MRCHPGKDFRGIRPPPWYNSLSFSEDDSGDKDEKDYGDHGYGG